MSRHIGTEATQTFEYCIACDDYDQANRAVAVLRVGPLAERIELPLCGACIKASIGALQFALNVWGAAAVREAGAT